MAFGLTDDELISDDQTKTVSDGTKTYEYNRITVTLPGSTTTKDYWVRKGYTITVSSDKHHNLATDDQVVNAYRDDDWESSDADGLLSSLQLTNSDMGLTTLNGKNLQDISAGTFVGAVNSQAFSVSQGNDFYVYSEKNGSWVNRRVDGNGEVGKDYVEVTFDDTLHQYVYTDPASNEKRVIDTHDMYVITDGTSQKLVAFLVDGEVYTGTVYGKHNEILLTGKGEDNLYHSYWGAERNDPDALIGNSLTVGQYNETIDTIKDNITAIHEDDIKEMTLTEIENGGTLGLLTNGNLVPVTDENGMVHYVHPDGTTQESIPGAVTITSIGGEGGSGVDHDVKIKFSNTDTDGTEHSFTVNAGSKVTAENGTNGKLVSITINGEKYYIPEYSTSGETGGSGTGEATNVTIKGDDNITVNGPDGSNHFDVSLNDDITLGGENGKYVSVNGTTGTISATDNISAGSFSTGNITIDGTENGEHTGTINGLKNTEWGPDYQITSGQAATEDQLRAATAGLSEQITNNTQNISYLQNSVNKLDNRVDRVGAGAAALAALHPQDFDPDAKWDFAAGYGNYRGASATAIGAFYRPNEDVMISVGGAFGGGENMVNAGLSFKIGRGASNVTTSRVAMAKEIKNLREAVAAQDAQIRQLTALVQTLAGVKTEAAAETDFPDVPENHWAYEAVHELAQRGLVAGYPDGTFGGERALTRYEFAQIIYNALQKGASVDSRLVDEFAPELTYFRIDTVETDEQGQPTIQRVRANRR